MSVTSIESLPQRRALGRLLLDRLPAWFWVAAAAGLLAMIQGSRMLADTDTYWQIKVGQWIIDHGTVPWVDVYSLTKAGAPWMSSSWLAQVLFAKAYAYGGWSGVAWLAALGVAATFAVHVHILERYLTTLHASFVTIVAFALAAQHFLARPHMLAMPFMVAWISGLIAASDRGARPSFWLLPLMVIWANLHGGFVLGLALIGPIALDALWNAQATERKSLALHWALFGVAALAASCLTPYGWNSLLASAKILDMGALLSLIAEWMPVNFSHLSVFEGYMLALIGAALYFGVVLSPTRILLSLGLLHMALSHIRNIEVLVLLLPVVLAAPLAQRFTRLRAQPGQNGETRWFDIAVAVLLVLAMTGALTPFRTIRPPMDESYGKAIAALREHNARRVFNDYGFGGYMIWADMKPFVDGRAELYGEKFVLDHFNATSLQDPDALFRLLSFYQIDSALLLPDTPAVRLLNRLDGWSKVFSSDRAVVFVRTKPIGDEPQRVTAD